MFKYGKAKVAAAINAFGYRIERFPAPAEAHYLERNPKYAEIIKTVKPFTISTYESIAALVDAVQYVSRNAVPGAILECGVWKGGFMMAAALALRETHDLRDLYLFDTFSGMTAPTNKDVDHQGVQAVDKYEPAIAGDHVDWCYAKLGDVQRNLASTGYPQDRCHFVRGDVLETLPSEAPSEIAILHLDTDWYESTLHELHHCYPRLSAGGVLIIDDYGHWRGCQKAVDEFFADSAQFLCPLDYSSRLTIKAGSEAAGWAVQSVGSTSRRKTQV
jgi:hypothetical protein